MLCVCEREAGACEEAGGGGGAEGWVGQQLQGTRCRQVQGMQ